jgi:hypothetical protein
MSPSPSFQMRRRVRESCQRVEAASHRILDWFHIAMKSRVIEQSALKHRDLSAPSGPIERDIAGAKWLLWHRRASKAIAGLKQLHDMFGFVPERETLRWNLRGTYFYLEANKRYLVTYVARYLSGLPLSSGIAEVAVRASSRRIRCAGRRNGRICLRKSECSYWMENCDRGATPIPLRYPKPEADPQLMRCSLAQ